MRLCVLVLASVFVALATGCASSKGSARAAPRPAAVYPLAGTPDADTWVQWRTTVRLDAGGYVARVRAVSATGEVQTGVRAEPPPDEATGWHTIDITAE